MYGNARVYDYAWVRGDACVYGDAWVYGGARVHGNAWVYGDACVCGDARVYGEARVSGAARVYGNASVSGNAKVRGNAMVRGGVWKTSPLYIQGTRFEAYMHSENKFAVGCQHYTFEGWHKLWRRIAKQNEFTEAEQREYIAYFNLACERYGKEQYKVSFEDNSGCEEVDE